MAEAGLLPVADVVLHARACGRWRGLEELGGFAGCVGGEELVAPPVDGFEQGQLRAGVGFSRRQMMRRSLGQFASSPSGPSRSRAVSSTTPASVRPRGAPSVSSTWSQVCGGARPMTARSLRT
jgi:hypothetical protein